MREHPATIVIQRSPPAICSWGKGFKPLVFERGGGEPVLSLSKEGISSGRGATDEIATRPCGPFAGLPGAAKAGAHKQNYRAGQDVPVPSQYQGGKPVDAEPASGYNEWVGAGSILQVVVQGRRRDDEG